MIRLLKGFPPAVGAADGKKQNLRCGLVVLKKSSLFARPFLFEGASPHSLSGARDVPLAGETRFEHATYGDQKIREKIAFFNEMHFLTCDKEL